MSVEIFKNIPQMIKILTITHLLVWPTKDCYFCFILIFEVDQFGILLY